MRPRKVKLPCGRTFEQIRNHYEVEKEIATRIKKATKEERKIIYKTMYNELFKKITNHSRLKRRKDPKITAIMNRIKMKLIEKYINKSRIFVEFAPGDCKFAKDICKRTSFVYGIDISDQTAKFDNMPNNFELIIYDGYNLEMQKNSVDVVFSDQLIEHLHPDDIEFHFQLVKSILIPKGIYVFRTPHRFSGPHDISRYFSDNAEGFHLKEWTFGEIAKILKKLKYLSWSGYWFAKGIRIKMPFSYFIISENILKIFPAQLRKILSKYLLPSVTIVAIK